MMMKRHLTAALLCFTATACVFAGCDENRSSPAQQSATPQGETALATSENDAADQQPAAPETFDAKFETTAGSFTIRVHRNWAPRGADRFHQLVDDGFYDDQRFFRVVQGFVVQWGIHGSPVVSQKWRDATIKDDPVKESNTLGNVVFATAGPNTRTTQLFINLGNNARLDGMGFAPFGEVIDGMDVVQKLYGGYGEAPSQAQGSIQREGNKFLDRKFPELDSIKAATVAVPEESSTDGQDSQD